jgi:hypothetical protein
MARAAKLAAETMPRLELGRERILAHRRRAGGLDERLPMKPESLRLAAWAGLQDSVPRAALLSICARVANAVPSSWEDPALVQTWGLRFAVYAMAVPDLPVFSISRLPEEADARRRAEKLADRLDSFLEGRRLPYGQVGHAFGINANMLRYAAETGRVLIRWDGARSPTVWMTPPPSIGPTEARIELARRFLHVLGPGTARGFGGWAGIKPPAARATFAALAPELVPVRSPIGECWILAADADSFARGEVAGAPGVRFLPSGDAYWLLWGADRALLVPDPAGRAALWTPRVWPGALLVDGEIAGTWRRSESAMTIEIWRPLTAVEREGVEAEAASLPLPGLRRVIAVRWVE